MVASPRGIEIGNGPASKRRIWKVGKELGRGACATVCALTNQDGSSTEFAIKLAPCRNNNNNKTKKKLTPEEANADLLNYEQRIFKTQFPRLQGTVIPSLPKGQKEPPDYGYESGAVVIQ
jgi:hypothetical protein